MCFPNTLHKGKTLKNKTAKTLCLNVEKKKKLSILAAPCAYLMHCFDAKKNKLFSEFEEFSEICLFSERLTWFDGLCLVEFRKNSQYIVSWCLSNQKTKEKHYLN